MSSRRPDADPLNPDPAPGGDDLPARHSLGRTIAAVPDTGMPRPSHDRSEAEGVPGAWFAVVLRGYDRAQVDARLAELDRRIRDEIVRADTAEAALATARDHARRLQDPVTPGPDDRGFGRRVERVLAAAEREAAELREKAATEAAEIVEKARAEADLARRQTEQALLGRAAKLDDEFAARSAALDAREQEVDRVVGHARTEAEQIRGEARRAADDESAAAEQRAADLVVQAERTIEQQRADATRDVGRMAALRDEIRRELSRLQGLLHDELDGGGDRLALVAATASEPEAVADLTDPGPGPGFGDVRSTIGAIPAFQTASVGVLPFGDRSAGGPANGRSFAFGLVPDMRSEQGADDGLGEPGTSRTSDDDTGRTFALDRTPTRSTTPGRGRR